MSGILLSVLLISIFTTGSRHEKNRPEAVFAFYGFVN